MALGKGLEAILEEVKLAYKGEIEYKKNRIFSKKSLESREFWSSFYRKEIKENLPFEYHLKENKIEITFRNEDEVIEFIEIIKKT